MKHDLTRSKNPGWQDFRVQLPLPLSAAFEEIIGGKSLEKNWAVSAALFHFLSLPSKNRQDLTVEAYTEDWKVGTQGFNDASPTAFEALPKFFNWFIALQPADRRAVHAMFGIYIKDGGTRAEGVLARIGPDGKVQIRN